MADDAHAEDTAAIVAAAKRSPSFRSVFAGLAANGYDELTITLSRKGVTVQARRQPAAKGASPSWGQDAIDLAFGDDDED